MSDTFNINVAGISHPILCGVCNEPIASVGEAEIDGGNIGCVACGNVGTIQEVADMAVEYAKDEGQLMFNRMARDTASNSEIMTFTGQTSHDKSHRFIVDLKI